MLPPPAALMCDALMNEASLALAYGPLKPFAFGAGGAGDAPAGPVPGAQVQLIEGFRSSAAHAAAWGAPVMPGAANAAAAQYGAAQQTAVYALQHAPPPPLQHAPQQPPLQQPPPPPLPLAPGSRGDLPAAAAGGAKVAFCFSCGVALKRVDARFCHSCGASQE